MDDKGCQSGHFLFVQTAHLWTILADTNSYSRSQCRLREFLRNELIPGQAPQLLEALESVPHGALAGGLRRCPNDQLANDESLAVGHALCQLVAKQ